MRRTTLDRQWDELMALCRREAEFKAANTHPKLVKFLGAQIELLAQEMGFSSRVISRREFRAERDGAHIVRVIPE
jgi:hypothetical protein